MLLFTISFATVDYLARTHALQNAVAIDFILYTHGVIDNAGKGENVGPGRITACVYC